MTTDRFKDGIEWWMDTKTYGAYPNPPQWHIDTGNLVRLVPQREWVGLTNEEIKKVLAEISQIPPIDFTTKTYAQAIEAKLKEKNT